MPKHLLPFIALLFFKLSAGQITFQKTYTNAWNELPKQAIPVSTGGYLVAGETSWQDTFYQYHGAFYLMKTNASGEVSAANVFGDGNAYVSSVKETFDHGFILGGTMSDAAISFYHYLFIKTDSGCNIEWVLPVDGSSGSCWQVIQTHDSGFAMLNNVDTIISGFTHQRIQIIRADKNGQLLWTKQIKTLSSSGNLKGYSLLEEPDNTFYITGYRDIFPNYGAALLKTDANGNLQWAKQYTSHTRSYPLCIARTPGGGYILGGEHVNISIPNSDPFLMRVDSNGNLLWSHVYGDTITVNEIRSLTALSDGDFVFASDFHEHPSLTKTDSEGNVIWAKEYFGDSVTHVYTSCITSDEGFVLSVDGGYSDFGLIKSDADGSTGCLESNSVYVDSNLAMIQSDVTSSLSSYDVTASVVSYSPADTLFPDVTTNALCLFTSAQAIPSQDTITIYPNPFSDVVFVTAEKQLMKHASVIICNVLGGVVFQKEEETSDNNYTRAFDLNFLPTGVYFFELNIDGERMVKRIVKE